MFFSLYTTAPNHSVGSLKQRAGSLRRAVRFCKTKIRNLTAPFAFQKKSEPRPGLSVFKIKCFCHGAHFGPVRFAKRFLPNEQHRSVRCQTAPNPHQHEDRNIMFFHRIASHAPHRTILPKTTIRTALLFCRRILQKNNFL